jgi:hypothetical protein
VRVPEAPYSFSAETLLDFGRLGVEEGGEELGVGGKVGDCGSHVVLGWRATAFRAHQPSVRPFIISLYKFYLSYTL